MLKILHLGFGSSWNAISRELNKLGDYNFLDWTAFLELGAVQQMRETLIEACKNTTYNILFMHIQHDNVMDVNTVLKIKKESPKTFIINYTLDVVQPIPDWFYSVGRNIDLTLCCNENDVDEFNSNGVNAIYMAPGYDEQIYYPKIDLNDNGEIVFLGNVFNEDDFKFPLTKMRIDVVDFMKNKFKEKFKVYGHGWKYDDGDLNHRANAETDCYRNALMALSISHFSLRKYSSDRIYRIMGSGCLCMVYGYPGIEEDFVDRKHLVIWHTLEELFDLVKFYSDEKNKEERKTIALEGQLLVRSRDTWTHRMKDVIKHYENMNEAKNNKGI